MKVLGLILEINPFHNGHKYFIEESIKKCNPDIVLAITSTSFTMRGDVSLLSKFDKTNILLDNNIDLVIELPVIKTLNSADFFAEQTVKTLIDFGITDISFGIEDGKSDILFKIFNIIKSNEFNNYFNQNINNQLSYKENFSIAFNNFTKDINLSSYLDKPNFTLAIQYLKTISKYNNNINIHPITRIDNYYNNEETNFKSAYNLRKMINNNQDISNYITYNPNLIQKIDYNLLLNLIKYKFLINNKNINNIHLITEGIENYISNNLIYNSFEETLENLCNKKYTKSRINRIFISTLLDIPNTYDINSKYYRILGFNNKGQNYINTLNKNFKKEIKTTLKNDSDITTLYELKATKLYSQLINKNLYDLEFKIPIKKEDKNDK